MLLDLSRSIFQESLIKIMNRMDEYVKMLQSASSCMPAPAAPPSVNEKLSEYYRQQYLEEQLEHELYYHGGGGDGENKKVASEPSLNSYSFWQITESLGSSINDLNVVFEPPSLEVQIDWGDGSAPENIDSGTNYNHAFVA